jgi:hypothetical protein
MNTRSCGNKYFGATAGAANRAALVATCKSTTSNSGATLVRIVNST